MQIKTIKKTIINKMNEWLTTITDEKLREDVKKNILVSGGSITSLMLNIPVNDFDIYIKDKSVLMRLVLYYTSQYNVFVMDGSLKQKYIDDLEQQYEKFLSWVSVEEDKDADVNDINNKYAIAVRTLKDDQIKLFTGGAGLKVNQNIEPDMLNYHPVFFSPNAISLSNDIQIVCRFHGNAEAIHKTFDFIHATNYFTFEDGLVTNIEALQSIITKQLKYQGSLYPLTSIIRAKKFINRGWNINAGEYLKIMFQISQLNLTDPDVLEEQLIGVDVAYFGTLIDILRGVESEKITSHYLNTLIDKVFNEADDDSTDQ